MLYISAILGLFSILGWLSTTDGQFDQCSTDIPETRNHDPSKICINTSPLSLTVFTWTVVSGPSRVPKPILSSEIVKVTLRQRGYRDDYQSVRFLDRALKFCFPCPCRDDLYHVWHSTCHLHALGSKACSGSCRSYSPHAVAFLCADICRETNTPEPTRDVDSSDSEERFNTKWWITSTSKIPTDSVSTSGTSPEKTTPVRQPTSSQIPTINNTITDSERHKTNGTWLYDDNKPNKTTAIVVGVLIPLLVIAIAIAGFIFIFRRRRRQASKTDGKSKQKNVSFENTDYVSSETSNTGVPDSPTKISNINYDLSKDIIEGGRFTTQDSVDAQGYSCLKNSGNNSDTKDNIYEELEDESYCRISDAKIQFIPEHPSLEQRDSDFVTFIDNDLYQGSLSGDSVIGEKCPDDVPC